MITWREKLKRSIGGQAVALATTTGIAQVVMALLYIYTARASSPADFGLIVSAVAIGTTAVGILDFGTNSYWTRELASKRLSSSTLGRRLASKLIYAAAALVVGAGIAALFFPASSLWVAGPIAISATFSQSSQVPLRGLGRGDLVAIATLAEKLVTALAFVILVAFHISPISGLWISLAVGSLSSGYICWRLTPQDARPRLVLRRSTNPWAAAGHYGVANVAVTAQALDIPTLTLFGGAGAAGIYAAVSRWTQPMGLLASAFSAASAPHIAKAHSAAEAWRTARKSIWLLGVAIALSILTAVLAPVLVDVLIGQKYSGSADVLRILALSTVLSIANQPLFVFLQSRGMDRPIALITVLSVLVQLTLVFLLAPYIHAQGAAIAALLTQFVLFVSMCGLLIGKWRHMSVQYQPVHTESASHLP